MHHSTTVDDKAFGDSEMISCHSSTEADADALAKKCTTA
jgi:hypothetical protein